VVKIPRESEITFSSGGGLEILFLGVPGNFGQIFRSQGFCFDWCVRHTHARAQNRLKGFDW
jgi:hypothetical protein